MDLLALRWQNILTIWVMIIALFLLWGIGHMFFARLLGMSGSTSAVTTGGEQYG